MTGTPYQYVVLRCVPRVDREEFVNVGVILYAQAADFLDARYVVDRERLSGLFPDLDVDAVEATLATMREVCRGDRARGMPDLDGPGRRFGWLSAPRSTVIQPGPVHGGLCPDPGEELESLCLRLVS